MASKSLASNYDSSSESSAASSASSSSSFDDLPDIVEPMAQAPAARDFGDAVAPVLEAMAFLGDGVFNECHCRRCFVRSQVLATARCQSERSRLAASLRARPPVTEYRSRELCIYCRLELDMQAFTINCEPLERCVPEVYARRPNAPPPTPPSDDSADAGPNCALLADASL